MPSVIENYVRTGKLDYELRLRSFLGRDSVRAAGAAAAAADENKLYQFADVFYRNQGPENSDYADDAFMRMIAEQVPGLDAEKVVAAADDPLAHPAVRDAEEFARGIGSTSTPDFYLRVEEAPDQGRAAGHRARGLREGDRRRAGGSRDPAPRDRGARARGHRDRRLPDVGALQRARARVRRRRGRLREGAGVALGRAGRRAGGRARAGRLRRDPRQPRAARGDRRLGGRVPLARRLRLQRVADLRRAGEDRRDLPVVRGERGRHDRTGSCVGGAGAAARRRWARRDGRFTFSSFAT